MPVARFCAVVLLALAMAGCGPEEPAGAPPTQTQTAGPLAALPECSSPPPQPEGIAQVEGLVLPQDSVVTHVTKQDPLVTVRAFVPLTPPQFEAAYPKMNGITVLLTENEIFEAELLVSNGQYRNFLKAAATCRNGSQVMAVVAPEVDAEGLPVPQRATPTPTPTS